MKILNRYILKTLIESYLICIILVLSFYIVINLVANFDKFQEYIKLLRKVNINDITLFNLIFSYYFYYSPLIFYNLSPIITLLAGIFTITSMIRGNELTPLKAGGISIYNVLYPFFIFGIIISLFMGMVQEFIIPLVAPEIEILQNVKHNRKKEIKNIQYCDDEKKVFYIGSYSPLLRIAKNIRIIVPYKDSIKPYKIINAKEGVWKNNGMVLKEVYVLKYSKDGKLLKMPHNYEKYFIPTSFQEAHILYSPKRHLSTLSSSQLIEIIKKDNSTMALVTLYTHITLPLSNLILLFLGIPLILRKNSKNFFLGASFCIIVGGCFYSTYIFFINLGYKEIIKPIFAAFFPIILFGSLAISFLKIVHT